MNADAEFKEFIKRQQRSAAADDSVDWNKQRDDWLRNLQELYDRVAEYLDEYIKNGWITLRESMGNGALRCLKWVRLKPVLETDLIS